MTNKTSPEETDRLAGAGLGGVILGASLAGPVGAVVGGLISLAIADEVNKAKLRGGRAVARKAFFSFHYEADNWRASQVRNIGIVEGNQTITDNDWETVKRGGDAAIQRWIEGQIQPTDCTVVLIGQNTAGRKWITYEINRSWELKKGVVGIHIHSLKDRLGIQSSMGATPLSSIVKTYAPPHGDSTIAYDYIKRNLHQWVEEAILIRKQHN